MNNNRKATPKSAEIEAFLTSLLGGVSRVGAVAESSCVYCLCMVGEFKDARSEKEYTISGMCQECQNKEFE